MTLNPRHPGISIFTRLPVRPQSEGAPFYGGRTHPTVGALARIPRIPRTNVTLPAALGRLIPLIPLIPQSSRQTNGLGFTRLGGLNAHNALNAHLPQRKNGDSRRLKRQIAPSLHPGSTETEEKRGHDLGR